MDILVISSYPERSQVHSEKTVGVGNYTKATLLALVKTDPNIKLRVWAEVFEKKESYVENKINVERIWRRGSFISLLKLFIKALNDDTNVIMLPFEKYMFGSLVHTAVTLPFLLFLKLKGKKIVLVMHQVLGGGISTFTKNPLKIAFFSLIRRSFYAYLVLVSQQVIVFEQELKRRLGKSKKVKIIPHAVIQEPQVDKQSAKEKLDLDQDTRYVMYFGYLSPYKGVTELLDIWDYLEGVKLIIGGGGNPNHMGEPEYRSFVEKTMDNAREKGAITTGFIPEKEIIYYFCAADLLLLPYTIFMSSSGPLSQAFSQGMGVMFSSPLRSYFNSADMKKALDEAGISIDEICFDLDKPIRNKILWAMHNLDKLQVFSSTIRRVRSWDVISQHYHEVLRKAGS